MASGIGRFLFGSGKKRQKQSEKTTEINDLINTAGRLDYELLEQQAKSNRRLFTSLVQRPVLAGSALFVGGVETVSGEQMTKLFQAKDTQPDHFAKDALERAIYPLIKNKRRGTSDQLVIGRSSDNDMVMPDYTISKHHAEIRINAEGYTIIDLGSTNGSAVNGTKLSGRQPILLNEGDTLTLGRYQFTFMFPGLLYARLMGISLNELAAESSSGGSGS
ncbi:MAG: FHA domain-containing protein [Magnetococcales bacterium]|nr:FHA domain-containing protein [Magnetococcales bacterium]